MLTMDDFTFEAPEHTLPEAELIAGQEMYNYARFQYQYHVWRLSSLGTLFFQYDKLQLPWDSVYHVLDNVSGGPQLDVPKVAADPFLLNEKYYKWILHVSDPNVDSPIQVTEKYILQKARLANNLMAFRAAQKNKFRYLSTIQEIPSKREALTVVNYDPLFRLFLTGILRYKRKIDLILATVMNTVVDICKLQPIKHHYINIPWTTQVYLRDQFLRTKTKLNSSTIQSETFHYLFMMHFLNWMDGSPTSLFQAIPKTYWKQINFVLTLKNQATVLNMGEIAELNVKNKAYIRMVNHLNIFALTGAPQVVNPALTADPTTEEGASIIEKYVSTVAPTTHGITPTDIPTDTPKADIEQEVVVTHVAKTIPDTVSPVVTPEILPATPSIRDQTNDLKTVATPKTQIPTPIPSTHPAAKDKYEELLAEQKAWHAQLVPTMVANITRVQPNTDPVVSRARAKQYMDDLDKDAEVFIQTQKDITPARKERLLRIAKTYKQLTIDGEKLEDILLNQVDQRLDETATEYMTAHVPTPDMAKARAITFDADYRKKTMTRDLAANITCFAKQGMFLVDVKSTQVSNELTQATDYVFTYEDVNGKRHTNHATIPTISPEGECLIGGIKKRLKTQIVNLPIVKLSDTRVSLVSDFNKALVVRNTTKAHSYITQIDRILQLCGEKISVVYGNTVLNMPISYEYAMIAQKYKQITLTRTEMFRGLWDSRTITFYFDYATRMSGLSDDPEVIKALTLLEKKYGTVFASRTKHSFHFVDVNNRVSLIYLKDIKNPVFVNMAGNSIVDVFRFSLPIEISKKIGFIHEWIDLNLVSKPLPVGFVLAYQYGLTNTLLHLKIPFTLVAKRSNKVVESDASYGAEGLFTFADLDRVKLPAAAQIVLEDIHQDPLYQAQMRAEHTTDKYVYKADDVVIKFRDCNLVFNRYPIAKSLIISGLSHFNTSDYDYAEMDDPDVYFRLMEDKGISRNYLKALNNFFELFVCPSMRMALEEMNEPTNARDLLIRCAVLLSTPDHLEPASMANHRIRGSEQFISILYNEMARQLANHMARKGRGTAFSINKYAVYQRIISTQSFLLAEDTNPIQVVKDMTSATFAGMSGRSADSFVLNDRKYPEDGIGIMSESSVDNAKVAINFSLTMDPHIANTRGFLLPKPLSEQKPTNMLSATALAMPCATIDDPKRLSFVSIQLSHMVPTKESDVCRVRTGYERMIGQLTTSNFAGIAKADGVVTKIDRVASRVRVDYLNGEADIFAFGEEYTATAGMYITQRLEIIVSLGDKVKKGQVICYNNQFFKLDKKSQQLDWKHGVTANVVVMENDSTLEDSSAITRRLGERMAIFPVHTREIALTGEAIIHQISKIGDHVINTDPLLIFENEDMGDLGTLDTGDLDTQAMLMALNRTSPTAKHTGKVVRIDAYYSCPISEMHPSLAKVVQDCAKLRNAQAKIAKGSRYEVQNPGSNVIAEGTKYKGIEFDKNTVLLQFYIQEEFVHGIGDKLVVGLQLKSTTNRIMLEPIITESGVECDAIFGAVSIDNRQVVSPYHIGGASQTLEALEDAAVDLYFDLK